MAPRTQIPAARRADQQPSPQIRLDDRSISPYHEHRCLPASSEGPSRRSGKNQREGPCASKNTPSLAPLSYPPPADATNAVPTLSDASRPDHPHSGWRSTVMEGVGHYPHAQTPDELLALTLPFLAKAQPHA
jgi:hypothetical protein